jgi:XTP/dITP diphosphohydrolase
MTAAPSAPELPASQPHPHLDQLIAVLEHLRAPGGCAWDAEQTHESLTRYLIEEAHELVEAIEHGTPDDVLEELGDVLYQVLFHADIAAASSEHPFTIDDVAARSTAKMVGRHPHVFGDVSADTADAVAANWETWKRQEKPERASVLDGVPAGLTALSRAQKVLDKAEGVGIEVSATLGADESVYADEQSLGAAILGIAAEGRRRGLDAERALRLAVRALEDEVRRAEGETRTAEGDTAAL